MVISVMHPAFNTEHARGIEKAVEGGEIRTRAYMKVEKHLSAGRTLGKAIPNQVETPCHETNLQIEALVGPQEMCQLLVFTAMEPQELRHCCCGALSAEFPKQKASLGALLALLVMQCHWTLSTVRKRSLWAHSS